MLPQSVPPVGRSAPPKTVVGPDFPAPVEADIPSPVRPSTPVSWFVPLVMVGLLSFGAVVLLLTGGLGWLTVSGGGSTPVVIPETSPAVVIPALPSLDSPILGKFVCLPGGTFQMGSPSSAVYRSSDETPHSVAVSSFCMMESEVTQGAWEAVMGSNPSSFSLCGNCPVEQVSWDDIQVFIQKVNKRNGVKYRLPTEAEWEYAARGGQSFLYSGSNHLDAVGWSNQNSSNQPHPICQKRRNGYGLCDMSGNVWEWVSDWYGDYSTSGSTFKADILVDPQGNASGSERVFRGGSWDFYYIYARVAIRRSDAPSHRCSDLGFRLVRTIP